MELKCDDVNQVYIWVDSENSDVEISPHFDYEDDALHWMDNVKSHITGRT